MSAQGRRYAPRLVATIAAAGAAACAATFTAPGAAAERAVMSQQAADALARKLYQELIGINTTDSKGSVTAASEALARDFRAAGFPLADVNVLGPDERKKNLVVRLHGSGRQKPLLLIGHLDVVEARSEDWSTDPFKLIEKDGYFYGRGALDMKSGDAIMATALLRLSRDGYRGSRDIILALTADEEGGCCDGVEWLVRNHRELIDAEFALNHDGIVGYSIGSEHGVPQEFAFSATEKTYGDYQLTVTNRGGHSSLPRSDNAIYQLAEGLLRVGQYSFPVELNDITRAYFERMASVGSGQRAADMRAITRTPPDAAALARLAREPDLNSLMRTTCVATRLDGGHANNALPQRAQALVNCRILPGHSREEVRQDLIRVLDDPAIAVRYVADDGSISDSAPAKRSQAPSPLLPQVLRPLESTVAAIWPGLPVVPFMNASATDGIYTRAAGIPTYGVAGIAVDRDDIHAHGRDERIRVSAFYRGNEFFYRYLKALTVR
jgi:acetylornithine deacetylase/succinyl-diaminopimelate desuccinylase-like protein